MNLPVSRTLLGGVVVALLALAGCYLPEKFTAELDFERNGAYSYRYEGVTVHILVAAALAKTGSLSAKDERAFIEEIAKMAKEPDVKRATYLGKARVDLQIAGHKPAGSKLDLLSVLRVETDKQGITTISSTKLDAKSRAQIAAIGANVDGKFRVKLPAGAEVLSHNATTTPSLGGLLGAYEWRIGSIDVEPTLRVRFAAK